MLTPVEDFWLRWHVEHSKVELAERARLVLEAEAAGGSPGQVAAGLGLPTQMVEGVLAEFEHDRLATFPRPSVKLDQLIELEPAIIVSRKRIAHLAKRLFSDTRPLHHLPRSARQLLENAALLPPLSAPVDGNAAPPRAAAGRDVDLLDGATLADFDAQQQSVLACILRLQHKGYRADRDPVFRRLSPAEQSQVRYLAALLQLAEALDHSQTHATNLEAVELDSDTIVLHLTGPKARVDGGYACRRSSQWQPVFHLGLTFALGPWVKPDQANILSQETTKHTDLVGEIFQRQLTAALRKWQASLPGAVAGDSLGLGNLLAAVTETQAAMGAFASVLKRRYVKDTKRPLKELHQKLAAVVEIRSALNDLETYCSGRPPAADLQALMETWQRIGRKRQSDLSQWLQGDEAAELLGDLGRLSQAPPVRRSKSASIRVAAGVLLDELCSHVAERETRVIADQPESYRRYRQSLGRLASALQALLLASGGRAELSEEVERQLADVQRLDGRIDRWLSVNALSDSLAEFLDSWAEQQARQKTPQLYGAQSVLAYRQARRTQWSRLRNSLPADWRPVRASRLRRRTNALLKRLERHKGNS